VLKSDIGHAYNASLNNYVVQHPNISCICSGRINFVFYKHKPITISFLTKLKKRKEKKKKTERVISNRRRITKNYENANQHKRHKKK
jgi:hypothetical protein